MKSVIDNFDSTAGWSGSSAKALVHGENEIPEFIAGLNSKSLVFHFLATASDEYVQKTIAFDLTGFDEIVFHFWSRTQKRRGIDYQLPTDFVYKIEFGDSGNTQFFVPTFDRFGDVTLKVTGITTCSKIRITCLHDSEDYIIVSYLVSAKDEIPRDIFQSIKDQLLNDLGFAYSKTPGGVAQKGILLGTVTGTTGDTTVTFTTPVDFLEKYAVLLIDDGVNSETHQIDKNDELVISFFSVYSGKSLLNDYSSANVYLIIPVEFGLGSKDILLPGIAIWGMNPEEVFDNQSKQDSVRDTYKPDNTVFNRTFDTQFRYTILIDCEARQNELIAFMSLVIRFFMARESLWINGKKIEVKSQGTSTFIEPTEGHNEIPKIQYTLNVEIKEEVLDREQLVETLTNNRTFTPRQEVL